MNIGMLFVDDAHLAKNIALNTARQGLPLPDPSQLAEAILARADIVRDLHDPAAVVIGTATPVTNSPAEMWVTARLVSPAALTKAGMGHFDAFAANLLSPVESIEHTAGGRLKMVTRLADYRNFPDLARMFRSFTDIRQTDQLGFELPTLTGGQATVHVVDPSDQQLQVAGWARDGPTGAHHLGGSRSKVVDPVIAPERGVMLRALLLGRGKRFSDHSFSSCRRGHHDEGIHALLRPGSAHRRRRAR